MKKKINILLIFILDLLIYLSCFFNSPKICAHLIKISLTWPKQIKKNKLDKKKLIILLYRSIGIRDFEIIYELSSKIPNILIMRRSITKLILVFFLKRKFFFNYSRPIISEEEYFKQKKSQMKKHEFFWSEVIKNLKKIFDGKKLSLVTFNWRYFAEMALYKGCNNNNLPVKLWCKESLQSDLEAEYDIKYDEFSHMFNLVDKIIVYNELTKKKFIAMNNTVKNKITVGGCPRYFDFIMHKRKNIKVRNILFLSFSHTQGVPRFIKNKKIHWINSYNETIKILNSLADEKKINIVIKRKNNSTYKTPLEINNKIKIIEYGHAKKFINDADIVIGHNSSATIEALINGKIVMVPFFENQKNLKKYLYNFNQDIIYNTKEKMLKRIRSLINKDISFPLKHDRKTIEYYFGNPKKIVNSYVNFLNN